MSNSTLISGTLLTNNATFPRRNTIQCIVVHYMAWYTSAKICCQSFVPYSRRASANYCIGKDGEIWMNVEEKNRAWTTGNAEIDNRSITIECANYMDNANGHVYGQLPDATWNSLVKLCADICKRNGISKLNYTGDKSGNLHKHKWYQATDCPGPWLDTRFDKLAKEVNKLINGGSVDPTPTPTPTPTKFGGTYKCTVNILNVRDSPSLSGNVVTHYNKNQTVMLDDWYTSKDGYIWGRYTGSTSGKLRYVAVGRATGKVESDDYLIKIS